MESGLTKPSSLSKNAGTEQIQVSNEALSTENSVQNKQEQTNLSPQDGGKAQLEISNPQDAITTDNLNNSANSGQQSDEKMDSEKKSCRNCGTENSPLWRKGSSGCILCNACGLYWARHKDNRPLNQKESPCKSQSSNGSPCSGKASGSSSSSSSSSASSTPNSASTPPINGHVPTPKRSARKNRMNLLNPQSTSEIQSIITSSTRSKRTLRTPTKRKYPGEEDDDERSAIKPKNSNNSMIVDDDCEVVASPTKKAKSNTKEATLTPTSIGKGPSMKNGGPTIAETFHNFLFGNGNESLFDTQIYPATTQQMNANSTFQNLDKSNGSFFGDFMALASVTPNASVTTSHVLGGLNVSSTSFPHLDLFNTVQPLNNGNQENNNEKSSLLTQISEQKPITTTQNGKVSPKPLNNNTSTKANSSGSSASADISNSLMPEVGSNLVVHMPVVAANTTNVIYSTPKTERIGKMNQGKSISLFQLLPPSTNSQKQTNGAVSGSKKTINLNDNNATKDLPMQETIGKSKIQSPSEQFKTASLKKVNDSNSSVPNPSNINASKGTDSVDKGRIDEDVTKGVQRKLNFDSQTSKSLPNFSIQSQPSKDSSGGANSTPRKMIHTPLRSRTTTTTPKLPSENEKKGSSSTSTPASSHLHSAPNAAPSWDLYHALKRNHGAAHQMPLGIILTPLPGGFFAASPLTAGTPTSPLGFTNIGQNADLMSQLSLSDTISALQSSGINSASQRFNIHNFQPSQTDLAALLQGLSAKLENEATAQKASNENNKKNEANDNSKQKNPVVNNLPSAPATPLVTSGSSSSVVGSSPKFVLANFPSAMDVGGAENFLFGNGFNVGVKPRYELKNFLVHNQYDNSGKHSFLTKPKPLTQLENSTPTINASISENLQMQAQKPNFNGKQHGKKDRPVHTIEFIEFPHQNKQSMKIDTLEGLAANLHIQNLKNQQDFAISPSGSTTTTTSSSGSKCTTPMKANNSQQQDENDKTECNSNHKTPATMCFSKIVNTRWQEEDNIFNTIFDQNLEHDQISSKTTGQNNVDSGVPMKRVSNPNQPVVNSDDMIIVDDEEDDDVAKSSKFEKEEGANEEIGDDDDDVEMENDNPNNNLTQEFSQKQLSSDKLISQPSHSNNLNPPGPSIATNGNVNGERHDSNCWSFSRKDSGLFSNSFSIDPFSNHRGSDISDDHLDIRGRNDSISSTSGGLDNSANSTGTSSGDHSLQNSPQKKKQTDRRFSDFFI